MIWILANWRKILWCSSYLAVFSFGIFVESTIRDAAEARAMKATETKRQEEAMIAANTEIKLATIEAENRTLKGKLIHETRKSDYRCRLPADGLLILQNARTGTASNPEGKMP